MLDRQPTPYLEKGFFNLQPKADTREPIVVRGGRTLKITRRCFIPPCLNSLTSAATGGMVADNFFTAEAKMLHPIQDALENLTSRQITESFHEIGRMVGQAQRNPEGIALLIQVYDRIDSVCPEMSNQIHALSPGEINQILNGFANAFGSPANMIGMANTPARSLLALLVLSEIKYRSFLAGKDIAEWAGESGVTGFDLLEAVDGPRFGPVRANLSDENYLLVSQAFIAVAETVNNAEEQENIETIVSAVVATRGPVGKLDNEQMAMLNNVISQLVESESDDEAGDDEYSLVVLIMGRVRPERGIHAHAENSC